MTRHYKANPEQWKKNARKRSRLSGQEYVAVDGKIKRAKIVKTHDCNHGRQKLFKCADFQLETLEKIHGDFYNASNFERQRDFIVNYVVKQDNAHGTKKKQHLRYYLPLNGKREQVCKSKFLKSLDISERIPWLKLNWLALERSQQQTNVQASKQAYSIKRHEETEK